MSSLFHLGGIPAWEFYPRVGVRDQSICPGLGGLPLILQALSCVPRLVRTVIGSGPASGFSRLPSFTIRLPAEKVTPARSRLLGAFARSIENSVPVTWTSSRRLGLVPLTGAITRAPEQLARQKAPSGLLRRLPDWVLDSNRRSKVDSSLTDRLGGESKCELSGAGWRADLYSAFGVQRKIGHLRSSKLRKCFSATGRRGGFVKIPAKRRDFGLLTSYFSDDND